MNDTKKPIHSGHRERVIEKFKKSSESFSDHELLELILFYSIPRKDTNKTAHLLLDRFGSIENVLTADVNILKAVGGIGERSAIQLRVIGELLLRIKREKPKRKKVFNFKNSIDDIRSEFKGAVLEKFIMLFLDEKKHVITKLRFENNSLSQVMLDISVIAEAIVACKPKYALLAHNHPSGICTPTMADDITTGKINMVCLLHGVMLVDHVIVTETESYSYFMSGRIDYVRDEMNFENIAKK